MARKDKILDVLGLSTLPENARIAKLAHRWIGKPFPREQARAIIKCYFEGINGRLPELTDRLIDEKCRQEKLHNDRQAFHAAARKRAQSQLLKYKPEVVGRQAAAHNKKKRLMEIAQKTFGPAVRQNFNEDTLALMSLISGEDRWYEVRWKDVGAVPVKSALIEVVTMSPNRGPQYNKFLLYRVNGRDMVARTRQGAPDIQAAWAWQLPEVFVEAAPILAEQGYTFQNDLEGQTMIVYGPDGSEFRRVEWTGRTVDD